MSWGCRVRGKIQAWDKFQGEFFLFLKSPKKENRKKKGQKEEIGPERERDKAREKLEDSPSHKFHIPLEGQDTTAITTKATFTLLLNVPSSWTPSPFNSTVFTFSLFLCTTSTNWHTSSHIPSHSSSALRFKHRFPYLSWGFSWVVDRLKNPQRDWWLLLWFPASSASGTVLCFFMHAFMLF